MNRKSRFRQMLIVTLMLFATVAIGLQPMLVSSGLGCNCDENATVLTTSCCSDQNVEEEVRSCCTTRNTPCCSTKPIIAKTCCCNPGASVCECVNCQCSESDKNNSSLPVQPANGTTKIVVVPTLICSAPFVGYPLECELKKTDFPKTVAEYAALTSQQSCILLSRFTC